MVDEQTELKLIAIYSDQLLKKLTTEDLDDLEYLLETESRVSHFMGRVVAEIESRN